MTEKVTFCFDFGNTRLKCGVFKNDLLHEVILLTGDGYQDIQQLLDSYLPTKSILSSVINHNPEIEILLRSKTLFHRLSYASKLPFTSPVNKPETIGADRIALAAAAVNFYPGINNLVIGMGSCVTYNFINKYSQFMGGSISPGMEMRFKSLQLLTAKLPLVQPEKIFPLIGYDTKTNILSGVMLGISKEIDGIIELYEEKFNNFNVLLTGGDTPYFAGLLKKKIFADPDLIFKGLYAISEYNNDTKT